MPGPPGFRPPGWRLPPEAKAQRDTAYNVRGLVASPEASERMKKREARNAKRSVQHSGPFHDGYGVYRAKNGRFRKDTTPKHKRPDRKVWEKPGRNELRRAKKAAKAATSHE